MNRYILVYNVSESPIPPSSVSAFIKSNRGIDQWSSIFPGAYLIKSEQSVPELHAGFKEFFSPTFYILAKINRGSSEANGWLSKGIWEWLKSESSEVSAITSSNKTD